MKNIFDAIRTFFAHTPRDYRDSSPLFYSLAQFERSIRGFSHRLDALAGLAPLTHDDAPLQHTLRDATRILLKMLLAASKNDEAAVRSILEMPDSTGYLESTTLQLLRERRYSDAFIVDFKALSLTDENLCMSIAVVYKAENGPVTLWAEEVGLPDIRLNTLGGAVQALARVRAFTHGKVEAARNHPTVVRLKSEKKASDQQYARILGHLAALNPADRKLLKELARGSSLGMLLPSSS